MEGRKLTDLRVVDLRQELEKRGLDTKGIKASLIERLSLVLKKEGINPDNFVKADVDSSADKLIDTSAEEAQSTGEVGQDHESILEETENEQEGNSEEQSNTGLVDVVTAEEEEEVDENTMELHDDTLPEDIADVEDADNVIEKVDVAENHLSTTTIISADDDELHLTIGDEEDKFIIDANENKKDDLKSVKRSDERIEPANCSIVSEVTSRKSETRTDSTEVKAFEKSEEGGKSRRKSRDDDRNTLLVTGLSSQTAATEIKAVFKKHGKIGGVKIMSNAKDPEGSRFALVAVMSSEDATTCIKNLHGFDLHGHIIHVDQARAEMLSADWVRKESTKSKKDKDSVSRKSANGSSRSRTAKFTEQSSTPNKEKVTKEKMDHKNPVSSSDVSKTTDGIINNKSKVADVVDSKQKEEAKSSSSKKDTTKSTEASKKSSSERKSSTEKRESRKDVIPLKHFNRRPESASFRGRFVGRIQPRPRYTHHDAEQRREDYLRERRYHEHSRGGHPYHHHHHPVRRDPQERIPFHRGPPVDARRIGRQQEELTFEDIYDTRQREKDRELERERREAERRRLEEEERQRLLDEEFKRLAKERERIEAEKAELKRQKEKMIIEEREKQRIEQAELEREKALLLRKAKAKRLHAEEVYSRAEPKKAILTDRSRHAASYSNPQPPIRSEREKMRPVSYRPSDFRDKREEQDRYSGDSHVRGAPLRSAPVRDRRSPSWEKERYRIRDGREGDRHSHRDRDYSGKLRGERRDEHKPFSSSSTTPLEAPSTRYAYADTFQSQVSQSGPLIHGSTGQTIHGRPATAITAEFRSSKDIIDAYYGRGLRNDHTSAMADLKAAWQPSREQTWPTSDRVVTEMPERWVSTTGSRIAAPVAPPPPIFSNPSEEMSLSMPSSFNSNIYNNNSYSEYKLPQFSSHRR